MQLLLTSSGLSTPELESYFLEVISKNQFKPHIAYINTAAELDEDQDHQWINIRSLQALKGISLEVVSVLTPGFEKVLENAGVIWVGGGNTFYLIDALRKSGTDKIIENLLQTRLYAGSSAGSIVATPSIEVAYVEPADENILNIKDFTGLLLTPFEVAPHTPELCTMENSLKYAKTTKFPVYAIDEQSAVHYDSDSNNIKLLGAGALLLE